MKGVLTDGYLYSHTGHSVVVHNGAAMERKCTFDDAVASAEALGEISAGYEEAVAPILWAAVDTAGAEKAEQPGTQGGL